MLPLNLNGLVQLIAALGLEPTGGRPSTDITAGPSPATSNFLATTSSSCSVDSYPDTPVPTPTFAPFNEKTASIFRYRKQQSVNLGSWFVQENWMVPSIFTCADGNRAAEHDVSAGWVNTTQSRQVLERHWDTWITESDFSYLASIGINTVRLPIGFWSLGPQACEDTPFEDVSAVYTNSWPRVLRAIKYAENHGLGVLVDLHGAPGSQNGQAHSGTSDGVVGLWKSPAYMNKTIEVLTSITRELVNVNNVVGIQLLNEPADDPIIPSFYNRTLDILRSISPAAETFPFYIHDAFNIGEYADFVAQRDDFLVEDHHSYFVYTPSDEAESATGHAHDVTTTVLSSLNSTAISERGNLVIDEWSCALTPQSLAQESNAAQAQEQFCTGQMNTYANAAAGWAFWSYYLEDCETDGGWCFKEAVGQSLPETFFSYPEMTAPASVNELVTGSNSTGNSNGTQTDAITMLENFAHSNATISTIVTFAMLGNETLSSNSSMIPGNMTSQPGPLPVKNLTVLAGTPEWMAEIPNSGGNKRNQAEDRMSGLARRMGRSKDSEEFVAVLPRQAVTSTVFVVVTATAPSNPTPTPAPTTTSCSEAVTTAAPTTSCTTSPLPSTSSTSTVAAFNQFANASPSQTASSRGYADGHNTGKVFAASGGMSRLGFVGQFIHDTLSYLIAAKEIDASQSTTYTTAFKKGLADAEAEVSAALTAQGASHR